MSSTKEKSTEEQREDVLLNLEGLYTEAKSKLVALGYDEEVALKAILRNGHCYGGKDILTNILINSIVYLNRGDIAAPNRFKQVFTDLRQLAEYSLMEMICFLQQLKPHLTECDALWCLWMSDLHIGRASVMELPILPSFGPNMCGGSSNSGTTSANMEDILDGPMRRRSNMANALAKAKANAHWIRANAAVRKLEIGKTEIQAKMEGSELSSLESVRTNLEVANREEKCLKTLVSWEKQKTKLQEDVAVEKQKISEFQQQMFQNKATQKENECMQEQKAKELALAQVDEEQNQVNASGSLGDANLQGDTIATLQQELGKLEISAKEEASCERKCLFCKKDEASVVFLPCSHQILCESCNDNFGKKKKAKCPCCRVQIKKRIHLFGACS